MAGDVYIYGMTLLSTIHRLKGRFPPADGYQEILETHVMNGGRVRRLMLQPGDKATSED